jgi:hypothetical protein
MPWIYRSVQALQLAMSGVKLNKMDLCKHPSYSENVAAECSIGI